MIKRANINHYTGKFFTGAPGGSTPINDKWFIPLDHAKTIAKKKHEMIPSGDGSPKVMWEGYGLKKFKGKFVQGVDKNVDGGIQKVPETLKVAEMYLEDGARKLTPAQVEEVRNFDRKPVHVFERNRHVPTTAAIQMLSDEARVGTAASRGFIREVCWPEVQKTAATNNYFIGIDPPEDVKNSLPSYRPADQLHLTLAYLGKRNNNQLGHIKQEVAQIAKENVDFNLNAPFYARFDQKFPHLGIEKNPRLLALRDALEANPVTRSGDEREFVPHVSLGLTEDTPVAPGTDFPINELVLFQTDPKRPGNYIQVEKYPLAPRNVFQKFYDYVRGF